VTTVGDHGLSCLDSESYAAVALSMQANAQAINETLVADRAAYTAYGNRYVRKFVSTFASAGFGANSGVVLPDGTAAAACLTAFLGILPAGWYAASANITYQEDGAVTANSYRRSIIWTNAFSLGNFSVFPPQFFQAVTAASNTASADSMNVNGWFYSDGVGFTNVAVLFGHGNTGSTMTVPLGGTVLTVRFLSTGLVT
jgi:hypothetical protein